MKDFSLGFVGIGAQKCGTTWIAQCLAEHPEICLSRPKELNFFNKTSPFYLKDGKEWNYPKGESWYKGCFDHCSPGQMKGEFTTFYLYDEKAPHLIKEWFPQTKIIVSLRNPVYRTFSHYHHRKERKKIKISFEKAIQTEPDFIKTSMYYEPLKRYFEVFSPENVLVLIYEEIQKNPRKFIQNVYRFLGVSPDFIPPSLYQRPKLGHYHNLFFKALIKVPGLFNLMQKFGISTSPKMRSKTKKALQKTFEEDIKNLEKFLKKDLSVWR